MLELKPIVVHLDDCFRCRFCPIRSRFKVELHEVKEKGPAELKEGVKSLYQR